MRKLFSLFVALLAITSLWAYDFQYGDLYYNITSETTAEVTYEHFGGWDWRDYPNYSKLTTVTIPSTVTYDGTTYSVTSIENYAFHWCSSLTSITIPNSITKVGGGVFYGCENLKSVVLSNNIVSLPCGDYGAFGIGENTGFFGRCYSLTSITIPNSVTSIGDEAFYNCSSLTSIIIPNSVTIVGGGVFYGCKNLKSVVLSNNIVSLPSSGNDGGPVGFFDYCSSLTSLTIPNSVTSIGNCAFRNCSSLTSITLNSTTPPSIIRHSYYDGYVFEGVDNSISIYVPCDCVDAYWGSDWSYFSNIQEPPAEYSINLTTNNNNMGIAQVDKNSVCGNQISATANYGYHFVQWSDGSTDNPRSLELTRDTVLTAEFAPNNYTLSIQSDNSERGTTSGDITTTYLDYVTISATANYGYHFSHWNDYNYDNPRQVQVTEDKTYTAYFDKNTYYITKNYDSNQGYVDGYSSGEYLDNITLIAEPNYGYHFVRWADGNTDNPRHFILTQDTTFSAEFAQTFSGQCGDNLYWSYQNNSLIISGFGEMYDERPWGLFTNEIQTVVLPNGITHIGNDAFSDCTGLNEITIPYTVTSIGDYAFAGCRKLVHVNCYAINPPMAESTSFANYNVYLNVPCDNLQDYQLDLVFGSFKYIQCMGADSENVPTDDVVVTPGTNDVTITWPTAENADTYTIVIQKGNEVFCTLTFNAEGQLLNIAFAPSRDGNNRPAQYAEQAGNGYRFTVTGLEAGTDYTYDITAKDASNQTINSHIGEFSTQSTTAVDNISTNNANIQKIIRNGQLLILRDGKTYTIMGQEIE